MYFRMRVILAVTYAIQEMLLYTIASPDMEEELLAIRLDAGVTYVMNITI